MAERLEVEQVLSDPAASFWLKDALRSALARDPVDAANDAEVLFRLLDERCHKLLSLLWRRPLCGVGTVAYRITRLFRCPPPHNLIGGFVEMGLR